MSLHSYLAVYEDEVASTPDTGEHLKSTTIVLLLYLIV